jgi:hypothetical protein
MVLGAHAPGHYAQVIDTLLAADPLPRLKTSPGTAIIPRAGHGKKAWIIANWDGVGGTAELPAAGTDVLTGKAFPAGTVKLGAFELLAIRAA